MAKRNGRIDIFSLIVGVLISLAAQGIYDFLFYYAQGKNLEENITAMLAFVVILLVITVVIVWKIPKLIGTRALN